MEIIIGADVIGTDGKLGSVRAMLGNAERDGVDALLLREHASWNRERIMLLPLVDLIGDVQDDGALYISLDEEGFQELEEYLPTLHQGPEVALVSPLAAATAGAARTEPSDYLRAQWWLRTDTHLPVVSHGTPLIDCSGREIGEIHDVSVETTNGKLARITLCESPWFRDDQDLPTCWVGRISTRGVVLSLPLSEITRRLTRRAYPALLKI